ncbi:glycosyltransferase [Flavobacterium sp. 7A]|uniref:glycosyltransferase n=1 Tax=Flavobacterium sp. 7A TaxID=2940571 RepID=UPI002226B503|nr:glycosyltransferase [Flavobacterium sp. 7A]MCW2120283.1 glycosyltransferase involved in cell wall biosynthesis [Flavobacterium sp. 7A]
MKHKLLFLIPSLTGGGAERTLINLLQKLDYSKFEVDLVVVLKDGIYLENVPNEVKCIFLFHNKMLVRILAWMQKKIGFNYLLKKTTQNKIRGQYDLGISFLDGNFTDLLFFMKGLKKRFTWVHSSYQTNRNFARFYENTKYVQKLKEERYGRLDGIYFVSNDAKEEFIEVFGEYPKMEVIYNFIDTKSVLKKAELETYPKSNLFEFVALGSLLTVKGFDRLIRASKIVKEKGFNFKVSILGSGAEKNNLESLVKEINLKENIDFLGFISNPYPLLKNADVFIMSSVSEALPTVLCEAMILGKATLVTNCSGCREIVANGHFGLMAEQSDQSLAENMIKYVSDPNLVIHYELQSLKRSELFDDKLVLAAYNEILSQ